MSKITNRLAFFAKIKQRSIDLETYVAKASGKTDMSGTISPDGIDRQDFPERRQPYATERYSAEISNSVNFLNPAMQNIVTDEHVKVRAQKVSAGHLGGESKWFINEVMVENHYVRGYSLMIGGWKDKGSVTRKVQVEGSWVINDGPYEYGTEVQVEFVPNAGYRFVSWSDGGLNPHTVTMNDDVVLEVAAEQIPAHTLTFSASGTGTVTATVNGVVVTSPAEVNEGADVILTATAGEGFAFDAWSGIPEGATISGNIASFTMPSTNVSANANFVAAATNMALSAPNDPAQPTAAGTVMTLTRAAAYDGTAPAPYTEQYCFAASMGKLWFDGLTPTTMTKFVVDSGSGTYTEQTLESMGASIITSYIHPLTIQIHYSDPEKPDVIAGAMYMWALNEGVRSESAMYPIAKDDFDSNTDMYTTGADFAPAELGDTVSNGGGVSGTVAAVNVEPHYYAPQVTLSLGICTNATVAASVGGSAIEFPYTCDAGTVVSLTATPTEGHESDPCTWWDGNTNPTRNFIATANTTISCAFSLFQGLKLTNAGPLSITANDQVFTYDPDNYQSAYPNHYCWSDENDNHRFTQMRNPAVGDLCQTNPAQEPNIPITAVYNTNVLSFQRNTQAPEISNIQYSLDEGATFQNWTPYAPSTSRLFHGSNGITYVYFYAESPTAHVWSCSEGTQVYTNSNTLSIGDSFYSDSSCESSIGTVSAVTSKGRIKVEGTTYTDWFAASDMYSATVCRFIDAIGNNAYVTFDTTHPIEAGQSVTIEENPYNISEVKDGVADLYEDIQFTASICLKATCLAWHNHESNQQSMFNTEGYVNVSGRPTSLLDGSGATALDLTGRDYALAYLFWPDEYGTGYSIKAEDASGLVLDSTTLSTGCYYNMFYNCTSLTSVPSLPATTLADYCYYGMFYKCGKITTAPNLPAPILTEGCYLSMFGECTSLNEVHCAATDISANECTNYWLEQASETGDFYTPITTQWSEDVSGIPSGWTRHHEPEPTYDYVNTEITVPGEPTWVADITNAGTPPAISLFTNPAATILVNVVGTASEIEFSYQGIMTYNPEWGESGEPGYESTGGTYYMYKDDSDAIMFGANI